MSVPLFPHYLFVFLDYAMSLLVATPVVVLYWRGVWMLEDTCFMPQYPYLSAWVCAAVGFLIVFWCQLMQDVLDAFGRRNEGLYMLTSRFYSQVMGIAVVTQWRGLWTLEDLYFGVTPRSALWTLAIAAGVITLAGALSSIGNSAPFVFTADLPDTYFLSPSRFNAKANKSLLYFFWDSAFTIFVVQALVISSWRGLWTSIDFFQSPDNPYRSARVSLISGGLCCILLYASQPAACAIVHQLGVVYRRIFEGVWNIAAAYASVGIWRGLWMITDEYFQQDVTYYVIGVLLSLCVLHTLYSSNSVHTKGIVVDGQTEGDADILFPIMYLQALVPRRSCEKARTKEIEEKTGPITA